MQDHSFDDNGRCSCFFPGLCSPVFVIEPDNIIFAEIVPDLTLDDMELYLSRIFQAVPGPHGNEGTLSFT